MGNYLKAVLTAIPILLVGAGLAANYSTIRRYLHIRRNTRDERPMGVTHTPRSHVVGPGRS